MKRYILPIEFYLYCKNYGEYNFEINAETLVTDVGGYGDCLIDFFDDIDAQFGVDFANNVLANIFDVIPWTVNSIAVPSQIRYHEGFDAFICSYICYSRWSHK